MQRSKYSVGVVVNELFLCCSIVIKVNLMTSCVFMPLAWRLIYLTLGESRLTRKLWAATTPIVINAELSHCRLNFLRCSLRILGDKDIVICSHSAHWSQISSATIAGDVIIRVINSDLDPRRLSLTLHLTLDYLAIGVVTDNKPHLLVVPLVNPEQSHFAVVQYLGL